MSPKMSILILFLSLMTGLLDAVSITTLVPLIDIINNGEIKDLTRYGFISSFLDTFGLSLTVLNILVLFSLFIIVKAIFNLIAMVYIGKVVAQLTYDYRESFLRALLQSKWTSITNKNSGEFINAINFEIPKAASIYRISCTVLAALFQVIALFVVLYNFSIEATIGGIFLGLILAISLSYFVKLASEQSKLQVNIMNGFISRIHEMLQSIKVVKAMNLMKFVFPIMLSEADAIKKATQKQIVAKHGLAYLREPIVIVFLCFAIYILHENQSLRPEILFASLVLFLRLTASIGKLQSDYQIFLVNSHFFLAFREKLSNLERNIEFIGGEDGTMFKGSIEYKNVSFSHDNNLLLKNVNLSLPNKGFVAISGESGSGKTTLVDMLLSFYVPNDGSICIDNRELQDVGPSVIRNQVGYVQQESFIFNDSVFANVGLGDDRISRAKVIDALKGAHAYKFVSLMSDGIDTNLGEGGSKLSGGEKQRISIARALARDPKILILDEATSALDMNTMLDVLDIVKEISKSTLVIAISHQKEVLDISDYVYKIKNNKVLFVS